jgi:AmiR/NasT family two-component response regulator
MKTIRIPNFRGWRILILHQMDDNIARLSRQLERLGIDVSVNWPVLETPVADAHMVFFDGDKTYEGIFPWPAGEAPVPLVALMGSEAPGRLEWVLQQGISAHMLKPIQSSGIFSTLFLAQSNFEMRRQMQHSIDLLSDRVAKRPLVLHATVEMMKRCNLEEEAAFSVLRSAAMNRQKTIEEFCASLDDDAITHLVRAFEKQKNSSVG